MVTTDLRKFKDRTAERHVKLPPWERGTTLGKCTFFNFCILRICGTFPRIA